MIVTETERLLLRHFNENDINALFKMNTEPDMLRYVPTKPFTKESEAEELFFDVILEDYRCYGYGRWAVELKETGDLIGFCGPKFQPLFEKSELSFRYFPQYWGKGIAFESAKAVIDQLKPTFSIDEAIALVVPGDNRSESVVKKLCMQQIGQREFMDTKVNLFHIQL